MRKPSETASTNTPTDVGADLLTEKSKERKNQGEKLNRPSKHTSSRPSLHHSLSAWWRRYRLPLQLFITFRLALLILPFAAMILLPPIKPNGTAPKDAVPVLGPWSDRLLGSWSHWDGEWYLYIAQHGYSSTNGTNAFYPLYPLLIHLVGLLFFGHYLFAAVFLSTLFATIGTLLFFDLVRNEWTILVARRALAYLLLSPTAFFLVAVYTEALFLFLAVACFWAARRSRWWLAGLAAAGAVLTKNQGFILLLPLAWEYASQRNWQVKRLDLKIFFLSLPVFAIGGWLTYNYLFFGEPLAFMHVQDQWHRHLTNPLVALDSARSIFFSPRSGGSWLPDRYWEDSTLVDFPLTVLAIPLCGLLVWWAWRRRLPVSYLLFALSMMIVPLVYMAPKAPLIGMPRFMLPIFPLYIPIALIPGRYRLFHNSTLILSGVIMIVLCIRFANWFWVA